LEALAALAVELAASVEQVELAVSGPVPALWVELRTRCLDHSVGMEYPVRRSLQMDAYLNFSSSLLRRVAQMLAAGSSVASGRELDLVEASAASVGLGGSEAAWAD
jgi:hypothetical protein